MKAEFSTIIFNDQCRARLEGQFNDVMKAWCFGKNKNEGL